MPENAVQPNPTGRPSGYSQDIADTICERIADGQSLRTICSDPDMPRQAMVFRWLAKYDEFSEQYARAREAQADTLADELLDIVDDGRNDWMSNNAPDNPGYKENGEAINRSRLRAETRKWIAGKLRPKKYGDKIGLEYAGPPLSIESIDIKIAQLFAAPEIGGLIGGPEAGVEPDAAEPVFTLPKAN